MKGVNSGEVNFLACKFHGRVPAGVVVRAPHPLTMVGHTASRCRRARCTHLQQKTQVYARSGLPSGQGLWAVAWNTGACTRPGLGCRPHFCPLEAQQPTCSSSSSTSSMVMMPTTSCRGAGLGRFQQTSQNYQNIKTPSASSFCLGANMAGPAEGGGGTGSRCSWPSAHMPLLFGMQSRLVSPSPPRQPHPPTSTCLSAMPPKAGEGRWNRLLRRRAEPLVEGSVVI